MGMVFGKIGVETRKFEVIATAIEYEVRKYPPSVIAEITYRPSDLNSDKDGGFPILAKYIGAFGDPHNKSPEKIAMTAPVITKTAPSEKISMTAPVVTKTGGGGEEVTMGFILPAKYTRAEDAPLPVDERVVVRDEGEKKYGAVTFKGAASESVVEKKAGELGKCLERDGYKIVGDLVLARYNPPWTLPPFRINEVLIPVE